jgi:hypothetical protein
MFPLQRRLTTGKTSSPPHLQFGRYGDLFTQGLSTLRYGSTSFRYQLAALATRLEDSTVASLSLRASA